MFSQRGLSTILLAVNNRSVLSYDKLFVVTCLFQRDSYRHHSAVMVNNLLLLVVNILYKISAQVEPIFQRKARLIILIQ